MIATPLKEFKRLFLDIVGAIVEGYGYAFENGYSRPRGVALEFIRDQHRLFAACEGDVVIIDLILFESPERYWRVSLNQALWFAGVRAVAKSAPIDEQLALFASEISRCYGKLLSGELSLLDSRYCFPLRDAELNDYLVDQRGVRSTSPSL